MFQVFVFVFFCLGPPTFSIANINLEIEPPFFWSRPLGTIVKLYVYIFSFLEYI